MDKNSGFTNVYLFSQKENRKINVSIDSTLKSGEAFYRITVKFLFPENF